MKEEIFNLKLNNRLFDDKVPFGGIHLNSDNRKIKVWYALPYPKFGEWSMSYWKEWELEYKFNDYKTQYVKCGKIELLNDLKKSLMKKAIDYLRTRIVDNRHYYEMFCKEKKWRILFPIDEHAEPNSHSY